MIQRLQKAQRKKGFTMVELIVVIAIIGILAAIILPNLNNRRDRINAARSAAHDFYNAAQTVFTKYSMYEAPININYKTDAELAKKQYMWFYSSVGGSYPRDIDAAGATISAPAPEAKPEETDLYIEAVAKNGQITHTYMANEREKFFAKTTGVDTDFGKIFAEDIASRIELQDGFYYIHVSYEPIIVNASDRSKDEVGTVKIRCAAFMPFELPAFSGSNFPDYQNNNLFFREDFVLASGEICGTFGKWESSDNMVGLTSTTLFAPIVSPPAP